MFGEQTVADRRRFLETAACGFGALALAGLGAQARANDARKGGSALNPLAARETMFAPRAKRVIFLFMQGGPSHVDTFDYKPALEKYHGEKLDFRNARKLAQTGTSDKEMVLQSPWKFQQYGECGQWVSELFPHIARQVDDLCFVHSLHTQGVAHGPSTLFLHTGAMNLVRPSVGSWITYGLGTENENLPGFVTINPSSGNGGPRNYSNAFLPACYQGTAIGRAEQPASDARFRHLGNDLLGADERRARFDLLQELNQAQIDSRAADDEANAVLSSFELAWRMQSEAPDVVDLSRETASTLAMYGIGEKETDDYGRQCLLARRLAEVGVRYIQVNYGDNSSNPRWDQHSKIHLHADHARATDKPVAGLIADLKARGLLEDTLIWWGGEFGRNPFAQGTDGRDHNPSGFTHFLAGGGTRAGYSHGATDEFGHEAAVEKVHMHDMHATLLHLLGLDHERLTFNYAGRNFRLTDVEGRVVQKLFA